MGMYNEVFKKCPNCKDGIGYLQIGQIVLGFGGFNLDDPATLSDLDVDDLKSLKEAIADQYFHCGYQSHSVLGLSVVEEWQESQDVCETSFKFWEQNPDTFTERQRLIQELTNPSQQIED